MGPGVPTGPAGRSGVEAGPSGSESHDIGAGLQPPKPGEGPASRAALPAPERPPEQPTQTKVPSVTISAAKAPSISLPKGGGAIQPLGETFKTNPSTGTGSYAVPLGLPEARGFSPGLALQYDSGSGNGLFGLGWSLSLGSVTRSANKRLPQYRDAEESDTFVLSGAEELVPARRLDGNTWVDDNQETPTHRIVRYRPRTEGAFSRIERWTHRQTGEAHWVVTTGANVKSFYGRSIGSRIADPANAARVFSWLLDRMEDDRGNVLEVTYVAEDLQNIPQPRRSEMHRYDGLVKVTNRYPKRIRYGNTVMGEITGAVFEVVFDYGEHHPETPTPDPTPGLLWSHRQDPFSNYRPGFEVRTYRLCQRVLVFHRFEELGETPCLVKSFDFTYDPDPALTRLLSVTAAGYTRDELTYTKATLPPLEFGYSLPTRTPKTLLMWEDSIADVDVGAIGKRSQWVDLDGDGLPGILTREPGGFRYHRNLSGGKLARGREIRTEPSLGAEGAQMVDLDGSGIPSLVTMESPTPGTFLREGDDWGSFRPFHELPNVDWQSAQVKHVDLDGDGRDDLLVVTRDSYVWYPSLGRDGYGEPRRFPRSNEDDDRGPDVPFYANGHGTVVLADMTGDGLADLVQVTHSQVRYWPGLGHGKFGAMVVMTRSPFLEPPGEFDGRRVRLADLDGTGTADLLYFDGDGIRIYWNQAGNSFTEQPTRVTSFPTEEGLRTVALVDAFGRGTSQIVYAPANTRGPGPALKVIDVVGEVKPYLLTSVKNHLGLETRVQYAPSTKFYLADRAAGHPWATKLPFPVQVVERVEVYDAVRRHRFVQEYSYHHGAYDPDEREFRGFGRVETKDVDWTSASQGKGLFPERPPPVNGEYPQPPVLTKTWYHLGIPRFDGKLQAAYRAEQWTAAGALRLAGPVLPAGMSLDEHHDALRAMRGQVLRAEVYGLDGTLADGIPVTVTETRARVRELQPPKRGGGANANRSVFFVHAEEVLGLHYEKNASDPRVSHQLTLEVDAFGVVTKEATAVYGRKVSTPYAEQQVTHVAVGTRQVAHYAGGLDESGYRLAVPLSEQAYELKIAVEPPGANGLYTNAEIRAAFTGAAEVPYEATAAGGQKRLLGSVIHRYYNSASLPAAFAEGTADAKALPYESYALSFTPGLVTQVYGTKVDGPLLVSLGYQDRGAEGFWTKSGRQIFDEAHFYLPTEVIDAFGRATIVTYDAHLLFVTEVADPLGNTVAANMDYRVLAPWQTTDPNGNRGQVAFDALGRVTAAAVMGKEGDSDGDTLSDPTLRYTYDVGRWQSSGGQKPGYVKTEHREKHGAANTRWLVGYAFFDGGGGVAFAKAQAEPETPGGSARWVASGRTVLNNKGNPVKQYEPYFSADWDWESEEALASVGVTAIVTYDALGRAMRTDMPDGTTSRVVFSSWHVEQWDPNDTVAAAGNLWRAARSADAVPAPGAEDVRAKNLAVGHAGTPGTIHLDSLGRAFLAVADNGAAGQYTTQTVFDLEGQVRAVVDPLGRTCASYDVAVDGQLLHEVSIDAGEKWTLSNAMGTPVRAWDAALHVTRVELDELERMTHVWVAQGAGVEVLRTRVLYGESYPSPEASNLRGRACLAFDGAGLVETASFDFKGNVLTTSRRLAPDFTDEPDWTPAAGSATPSAALSQAALLLETETFSKAFSYDALNRTTSATMPDLSELRPTFNEAGQLETVHVRIRGATDGNGDPMWTAFVTGIAYDEKGRRTRIDYGNGTFTEYFYDPLTFRLTRLRTMRSSDGAKLQDLFYFYDPVGNITTIRDDAQQDVFFAGQQVTPTQEFEYDAIYRLISATGREHAGGVGDVQLDHNDLPLWNLPHPNDAQALRMYTETYAYDGVGNIQEMFHDAGNGSPGTWRRRYAFGAGSGPPAVPASNRLHSTSLPGDPETGPFSATYTHDANGNMVAMPHLAEIGYTHADQMKRADLGGGGTAYYTYDASGERVRKVIQRLGTTREERIYLGGWELYRKRQGAGGEVVLERETLHVMDDTRRIAMVETKTVNADVVGTLTIVPRIRYQYGNHLDSAHLECDGVGLVISYEEYHPYGTPAYRSARNGIEVSEKRYRYTGKERDDETGFQYHSARYLAPWLGRWTSADPIGIHGGICLYKYASGNPLRLADPNGREPKTTYLGSSRDENYVARLRSIRGDRLYWSEKGSNGAGWYVRPDATAPVTPSASDQTSTAMPDGEGLDFLSWSPASPLAPAEAPPTGNPAPTEAADDVDYGGPGSVRAVADKYGRMFEEFGGMMPMGDHSQGPTGGGALPGEDPGCPSRGCHATRHPNMSGPHGTPGSGDGLPSPKPAPGQAWSEGGKGEPAAPPAGTPARPPKPTAPGGASPTPAVRPLEAGDLGLSRASMEEVRGTVLNAGTTRIVTVDMIRGKIPVGELRAALSNMLKSAKAGGVRVLQIEATFANEGLEKLATAQAKKLGGTVSTAGGKDTITFIIEGSQ